MAEPHADIPPTDVAIVGLACRFAGAPDPEAFWDTIRAGEEQLTTLTDDELRAAGVAESILAHPSYIRVTSLIDHAHEFDAGFFGITASEAELIDPQHRLFLELCWQALEDAGYDPARCAEEIGVFAGGGRHAYLRNVEPRMEAADHLDGSIIGLQADIGNYGDFLATRASFKLGLRGPSLNVQTACSTALVAVHLACQSLFLGESDMALAGGVSVHSPQVNGYLYEEGSICSPSGHLRAFDAGADGSVFGNGGGVVLLKRLADALADGDRIVAVIKGSAINNDGSSKMSFTAPAVEGQAEVIARAQRAAGVDPRTIGYVEAHGTGTALGDPIEVAALVSAFDVGEVAQPYCALGSVKAQIGHLGPAAGIAGLIKAALAVERGEIPRCVNFEQLNPRIPLDGSPFYVARELTPWAGLRRAGVSAFGVGGTNAHAILEQAPERAQPAPEPAVPLPFVLSARSPQALDALRVELREHVAAHSQLRPRDVAHVLATGRRRCRHRLAVAASTVEELAERLGDGARVPARPAPEGELPVVFAFPGQGAQFVGLGRSLYLGDPAFRATVDASAELLRELDDVDVRELLFPAVEDAERAATRLREAQWAQPAVFVLEHALGHTLIAAGIRPAAMVGHSLGEYAAACLAGVFSLRDALRMVAARGRLTQGTAHGGMTAVGLDEPELLELLPPELDIAAVNAPGQCVVSGPVGPLELLEQRLEQAELRHTRLGTSHGSHSSLMDPILDEFRALVATVELAPPTLPIASSLIGGWGGARMSEPEYWVDHLRRPVRFMDAAAMVLERGPAVVLEAGPGRALTRMVCQLEQGRELLTVTPWIPQAWEPASLAELVGELWAHGAAVDWDVQLGAGAHRRVPLPGYPFERSTYWLEPPREDSASPVAAPTSRPRAAGWLQRAHWSAAPRPRASDAPARVLALLGQGDEAIAQQLADAGSHVVTLAHGPELEDVERLLPELLEREAAFDAVVCVWPAQAPAGAGLGERAEQLVRTGMWPLLRIVGELSLRQRPQELDVLLVTRGRHKVSADDVPQPELALLAGPAKVIPQEYPNVRVAELDVDAAGAQDASVLAAAIADELAGMRSGEVAALRGGVRRVLRWEPSGASSGDEQWQQGATYLITGGLGGIGLALAEDAAAVKGVRLVLTHRAPLPAREQWSGLVSDPATPAALRDRLASLLRIEALPGEVRCVEADVTDREAMRAVRAEHGPFTGIVHAAGLPGGKLIADLDAARVERILAPKVTGAIVLHELVADEHTDWMLLCSSMSSVVGGLGHADYCSANAFLDAFAEWRTQAGDRTLSLAFDAWTESGMAVNAARAREQAWTAIEHPSFAYERVHGATAEYRCDLRADIDWIVDEHRIAGEALLPGTGIVELIRAAAERRLGSAALELSALDLLRPVSVPADHTTPVTVRLEDAAEGLTAALFSVRLDGTQVQHAAGQVRVHDHPASPSAPFATNGAGEALHAGEGGLVAFGPRWDCVRSSERIGPGELLVELELDGAFHADVEDFGVHPALLDMATGMFLPYLSAEPHLPMSYERIAIHRPMPARIRSRILHDASATDGSLRFDVWVQDLDGNAVLELEGYALRPVDSDRIGDELHEPEDAGNVSLVTAAAGDLDALRFVESARTPPRAGEVEVEVLATGLNFKEVLIATGMLSPSGPEHRFGLECAGIVRAVGPGVTDLRVGDAVMAIGSSCFSRFVNVRASLAGLIPAAMTFSQAASIPIAFTTAYDCLVNVARLERGERVLVHAAAGGVGLAAIQIATHLGAEVLATAGNETKRDFVRALGASRVMDSRTLDFAQETIAAGGVDVVLNSLSGDGIAAGMRTLRHRGRFVEIGRRDILGGGTLDLGLFAQGCSYSAYNPDVDGLAFEEAWRGVLGLLAQGAIGPLPVRAFDATEPSEAFTFMARAHHIGKVALCRPGADRPSQQLARDVAVSAGEGITAAIGMRAIRSALSLPDAWLLVSQRQIAAPAEELIVAEHVLAAPAAGAAVHARPALAYDFVPLQGEVEERIGAIWGALLGVDQVGAEDHFLDLGGDSLYATQAVARIRGELDVRVAPADLLGTLSLRGLAELVERQRTGAPLAEAAGAPDGRRT